MRFENYAFDETLKENLETAGFKKPTDIQYKAIPSILQGEDVLAIAQTGTGKTAAFAIPVIHRLLTRRGKRLTDEISCLILVPTRELALQIAEVFHQFTNNTHLQILALIGGVEEAPQIKQLKKGVDVLISTPGRMFDLKSRGELTLMHTGMLILDEADKMLALGFYRDIRDVVYDLPRHHQTLFFSATINEEIKDLAYSLVKNPIRIQLSPKDPVSKNVDHSVAFMDMDDKRFFLERLIRENPEKKILVFVRTKVRAERVHAAMLRVGIDTLTLHGDKDQQERLDVLEKFRSGSVQVMIATDVSARGIDIKGIQLVLNYDLPDIAENYVHRVGRTGRAFDRGHAYSFCAPEEEAILHEIETYIGKEIKRLAIDKADYSMTKAMSEEPDTNWKKLLQDAEKEEGKRKRKK